MAVNTKNTFDEIGFVKQENVLTQNQLKVLEELLELKLGRANTGEMGSGFSRLVYDIESQKDSSIYDLICNSKLADIATSLAGEPMIFTQSVGFEITHEHQKGFGWHFGNVSFNYINLHDRGLTLWIPLDPVDTTKQGGGLSTIPLNVSNAIDRFRMVDQMSQLFLNSSDDEIQEAKKYWSSQYSSGDGVFCGDLDKWIFDRACHDYSYDPGDLLVFDKKVWHKGSNLKPGPQARRRAFVMRFVSADARYAKNQLERFVSAFFNGGYFKSRPSQYGDRFVDIKDGDFLRDSEFTHPVIYGKFTKTKKISKVG